MSSAYDPSASFEVSTSDTSYGNLQDPQLLARVYTPQGKGPFPAIVSVHGGAWGSGNRLMNKTIDEELARSGILVVAIDCRLSPKHVFPSQVEDFTLALQWLKTRAGSLNIDPRSVGALGGSSGGHTVMTGALKAQGIDQVSYAVLLWPVLDPYERYLYAKEASRKDLVERSEAYFKPLESMMKGNPQAILDDKSVSAKPPVLIIQGSADTNVPLAIPERFVKSYQSIGGEVSYKLFDGMPHGFAGWSQPLWSDATANVKQFISRQLNITNARV